MTIQEIFSLGEDGVLDYDTFNEIAKQNGMKLVNLSDGGYVSKKKYEDDLAAKDSDITNLNEAISKRDTDLEDIKTKLEAAGTDAQKLADITNSFSDLKTKYENDVKEYQAQLAKQAYEFAVKDFANSKKFSSNAAKRDFISTMMSKGLEMKDGKIVGAEDFAVGYLNDNSDAFMSETPVVDTPPVPTFVAPVKPVDDAPKSLTDLMRIKNENPDAIIGF